MEDTWKPEELEVVISYLLNALFKVKRELSATLFQNECLKETLKMFSSPSASLSSKRSLTPIPEEPEDIEGSDSLLTDSEQE